MEEFIESLKADKKQYESKIKQDDAKRKLNEEEINSKREDDQMIAELEEQINNI
jgi:hypothetical protein